MYKKCIDRKAHSGSSCTIQKVYKDVYFFYTLQFQKYTTKCILHKCTQKVYKCIQNVQIAKRTQATHVLYKKCSKMSTFCIHFSSKCILQNAYFINLHKVYSVMYTLMLEFVYILCHTFLCIFQFRFLDYFIIVFFLLFYVIINFYKNYFIIIILLYFFFS